MTIRQMIRPIRVAAALAGLVAISAAASAADKAHVRVLILTGANNHDWRQTTPVLKSLFEGDERFTVVGVVENPSSLTAAAFARCDVVVSNWSAYPAMTGRQWGREAEGAFVDFVRSGKGFVAFHAASATSQDWPEFQQLVGLTWGLEKTGHGSLGPLRVTIADKDHPITKGMVDFWTVDELWHNMVAIAKPEYRILCTAFSRLDQRGSGKYEPALICTQLGKGRGVNLILGHDVAAMRNVGWRTLMLRSAEWAATGAATVPIPADWPTTSLAAIATNLDADAVLKGAAAYRFGQSRQALLAVEQLVMYSSSLPDSAAGGTAGGAAGVERRPRSQELLLHAVGEHRHAAAGPRDCAVAAGRVDVGRSALRPRAERRAGGGEGIAGCRRPCDRSAPGGHRQLDRQPRRCGGRWAAGAARRRCGSRAGRQRGIGPRQDRHRACREGARRHRRDRPARPARRRGRRIPLLCRTTRGDEQSRSGGRAVQAMGRSLTAGADSYGGRAAPGPVEVTSAVGSIRARPAKRIMHRRLLPPAAHRTQASATSDPASRGAVRRTSGRSGAA